MTTTTPATRKSMTQAELVQKLTAEPLPPLVTSVHNFVKELDKVQTCYVNPCLREIERYLSSQRWKDIQELHRKRKFETLTLDCEREIRNKLARLNRYMFKDGVKIKSVHRSDATDIIQARIKRNDELKGFELYVMDYRFRYGSQKCAVLRYERTFHLPAAFYKDIVALSEYVKEHSLVDFKRLLEKLPEQIPIYDRLFKLQALRQVTQ